MKNISIILTRIYDICTTVIAFCMCALIFMSSCTCSDSQMENCNFTEIDYPVIKMFNPDNWWVYENVDGSIRDSLYLTSADTLNETDNKGYCKNWIEITCHLKHFRTIDNQIIEKENPRVRYTTLFCKGSAFLSFDMNIGNSKKILINEETRNFIFDHDLGFRGLTIENLHRVQFDNIVAFYKKDFGLFGWIDHSNQDTFYLTNYFFQ